MPLVRHIGSGVWEVRCKLRNGIARVLFVMEGNSMVLIHGFIKKDQKIPKADLDLAKDRAQQLRSRL
jgi:phage-related protein